MQRLTKNKPTVQRQYFKAERKRKKNELISVLKAELHDIVLLVKSTT